MLLYSCADPKRGDGRNDRNKYDDKVQKAKSRAEWLVHILVDEVDYVVI